MVLAVWISDVLGHLEYWKTKFGLEGVWKTIDTKGTTILALAIAVVAWLPIKSSRQIRTELKLRGFIRKTKKSIREYEQIFKHLTEFPNNIKGPFEPTLSSESKRLTTEWDSMSSEVRKDHLDIGRQLTTLLEIEHWRHDLYADIQQFREYLIHTLEKSSLLKDFPLAAIGTDAEASLAYDWDGARTLLAEHIRKLKFMMEGLE